MLASRNAERDIYMLNDVRLQGRLTAKPELRTTNKDQKIVSFTLAVERNGKDAGVDFINVVAFNKTAEFVANHLDKGQQIVVEAKLQSRTVTDKNTSKNRTVNDVVVNQVYFCGSKPAAHTDSAPIDEGQEEYEEIE